MPGIFVLCKVGQDDENLGYNYNDGIFGVKLSSSWEEMI